MAALRLSQRSAVAAARRGRARRRRAGAPDLRRALEERHQPRHRAPPDPVGAAALVGHAARGASAQACARDAQRDADRRRHDVVSALPRRSRRQLRRGARRARCARSATTSTCIAAGTARPHREPAVLHAAARPTRSSAVARARSRAPQRSPRGSRPRSRRARAGTRSSRTGSRRRRSPRCRRAHRCSRSRTAATSTRCAGCTCSRRCSRLLRARGARLAFVSAELRDARRTRRAARLDATRSSSRWASTSRASPALARAPADPPIVLVVARLVPIKGVDVALAALAHLRAPVRLVIAGDGPERAALTARPRAHVRRRGVDRRARSRCSVARASSIVAVARARERAQRGHAADRARGARRRACPVVALAVGGLAALAGPRSCHPTDARSRDRPTHSRARSSALPPRASVAHLDWAQRALTSLTPYVTQRCVTVRIAPDGPTTAASIVSNSLQSRDDVVTIATSTRWRHGCC